MASVTVQLSGADAMRLAVILKEVHDTIDVRFVKIRDTLGNKETIAQLEGAFRIAARAAS